MQRIDTIVIGGGQAGLAMSRCLTDQGRDHLVIERGRPGERWRSQTWDSLRLLTPNWMTRLPGRPYGGSDPEGFMTRDEFVSLLEGYAGSFDAPVHTETSVRSVEPAGDGGFAVRTDQGTWLARHVVIATGDAQTPQLPAFASAIDPTIEQVTTATYRNPAQLPDGGVLVVGASASGVQLADELRRSGRDVVLAVGNHSRLPRRYRGIDIMWWLDRSGSLDRTVDEERDPYTASRQPSSQLIGRRPGQGGSGDLDLLTLHRSGVRLAGRLVAADGSRASFADDLAETTADAAERLDRTLCTLDRYAEESGLAPELFEPHRPEPVPVVTPPTEIDLRTAGISTVLWATGYRRSYPWLQVPVLDQRGEIQQRYGITDTAGLYTLGLRLQRRRKSHFIDGVGDDARFIADHIAGRARRRPSVAA